jgi:hypothetical protein
LIVEKGAAQQRQTPLTVVQRDQSVTVKFDKNDYVKEIQENFDVNKIILGKMKYTKLCANEIIIAKIWIILVEIN